jgi:signal transduction histidine kinase
MHRRGLLARVIGRARLLVGPRPAVLVGSALLVAALTSTFAYEVTDSQATSRRQAERSFAAEAKITSQLTSSLFTSSVSSAEAAAAKAFGSRVVDREALTALARRSGLTYAVVLGRNGKVLAETSEVSGRALGRLASPPPHVRAALRGQPWLSGLLPGGQSSYVIEFAVPFQTRYGRRVEVEGLNADALYGFLSGYVKQSGSSPARTAYIVDGQNNLVAASGKGKLGERLSGPLVAGGNHRFHDGDTVRYVAAAPLANADWRVLLSEPTSALYPALAGSNSWVLFAVLAAFGVAGCASLAFLRGALVGAARVAETNRELAEMNATLEERVAERTAVAELRAKELARSNAELEQFASVASHDLQEPLRKIRMYCERLPKRLGDLPSEEAASDLERMQNAAQRMQRLIDDLLSFARVTSRQRALELVDLGEIAGEVIGDLEPRIAELGARIEIGELPIVAGDRGQLAQLLQNLVSNAVKFHREGVPPIIRIRAEALPGQPSRFAGEAGVGSRYAISVEDNGIGFEEEYAERVFSAFERLHSRSDYEGTGIGLSIARKIAWRHNGEISATSTPGEGSTFTLTLPIPATADQPVDQAA